MATPTLDATGLTTIALGDSITNWGGDTFSVDTEIVPYPGGSSVSCAMTTNGANDAYVDGSWNLTNEHLRLFFNVIFGVNIATEAADGIQAFVSDGTNTDYLTVAGSDTYGGGWLNLVVVANATNFPTVNLAAITRIGMRFNTTSKPRNQPANAWFSYWKFGDGIIATGGTSGDPINIAGIAAEDAANGYGVVNPVANSSAVLLTGSLQIGDVAATYYKDDNVFAEFLDLNVATTLYALSFVGASTDVELLNSVYKSNGPAFDLLLDDAGLASAALTSVNVTNAQAANFKTGQTLDAGSIQAAAIDLGGAAVTGSTLRPGDLTQAASSITDGIVQSDTAVNVAVCDDFTLADVTNLTVTQANAGHFVDYGTISTNSGITWTVKTQDFPNGTAGDPATTTSNGDETILVSVDAGITWTITVAAGASIPSVKNDGAGDVAIVVPELSMTISGHNVGDKIIIYDNDSADPQELGTELIRWDPAAATEVFSYAVAKASDGITLRCINPNSKPFVRDITLESTSFPFEINLEQETN